MNLWVKRAGQLLVAVLFLMSCEDDSFLLGFRNQKQKFDIRFVDIPLESSVLLIDSIITDNHNSTSTVRLMVGQYTDPQFGLVKATTYSQIGPSTSDTLPPTATLDSLVLQLALDYYVYGASGVTEETFTVHEITEDSLSFYNTYFYNSSMGYGPALATGSFMFDYEVAEEGDSIMLVRVKIDIPGGTNDLGERLLDAAKNNTDDVFKNPRKFKYAFKGLVLVPTDPSSSIVGINPLSGDTNLELYYQTEDTDSLVKNFRLLTGASFNLGVSFNNIKTDRSGDLAPITGPYMSYQPASGLRHIQSGSPAITKLDLNAFYDFADTIDAMIINKAELIIDPVEDPGDLGPPSALLLQTMKENDLFFNESLDEDSTVMNNFWIVRNGYYYYASSDFSSSSAVFATTLRFDDDENAYSAFNTRFFQNLFDTRNNETTIRYLGLISTNPGKTVNRVVFNQSGVKLRVYFTTPRESNL